MLVLSRQRDETIMIGDDIEITVVDIRGDKVRLGISAPATIPVHRKEVYEAIQRENRDASRMKAEDFGTLPKGKPAAIPPGLHRPATMRPGRKDGPGTPPGTPPTPPTPPAGPEGSTPPPAPPAPPAGPASAGPTPTKE